MSQQPVMGEWEIRVTISGKYSHQNSKEIKVQLYTLPKFSLHMQAPQNLILAEPHIRAEIYGKYTFDKYVEGILHVELRILRNDDLIEQQTLHIDGLVVVEFHLENPQKLVGVDLLHLNVMFEEKHTSIWQNVSHYITVREQSYELFIPYDEIEFRNNRPFRLRAHVEDWNDGPIWDSTTPVYMEHGTMKYQTYLNEQGVAVFEFEQQQDAAYTVTFKDSKKTMPNIYTVEESDTDRQKPIYCNLRLKER